MYTRQIEVERQRIAKQDQVIKTTRREIASTRAFAPTSATPTGKAGPPRDVDAVHANRDVPYR